MCFREYNNGGSKRAYKSKQAQKSEDVKVINVFHDVISILYTVHNITLKLSMFSVVKT